MLRLGPFIYSNGLVKLEILENCLDHKGISMGWDYKKSNLSQILLGIQSLIMVNDVYFTNLGTEFEKGTIKGENFNKAYSNIIKYYTIKFGMIEILKNPPFGFQEIVKIHFYYKKREILNLCQNWLDLAKNEKNIDYGGLVSSHNWSLAQLFKRKYTFFQTLKKNIIELEEILNKIKL